jgi:purine-nucleoside phosphorylase
VEQVSSQRDRLAEAVRRVAQLGHTPRVGVVLGSGLGDFAEVLRAAVGVKYADIPHFPAASVPGHEGVLSLGHVGDAPVACLRGRTHLYEGHSPEHVVFGVRILAGLGCRTVLLTNAAGAIRAGFAPGELMLISDHLNLTGTNPLVGGHPASGRQFVDMTHAYDPDLRQAARDSARQVGVVLHEGCYAGVLGPSYETPAEVRLLHALGADAVGMSTVLETIALRSAGVRVGAISCLTNLAAGLADAPLDHAEVTHAARHVRCGFAELLVRWIQAADLQAGS